jgi:uncharacterized LabA/DUF88 family protein
MVNVEKKLNANSAFVDAQNLYLGTKGEGWLVDHKRFCVFLNENYRCDEIYLFIGNLRDEHSKMYVDLQKAGYILIFREHANSSVSEKKGNVDTDLMFELMRQYAEENPERKFIIVSGDGDYFKAVRHLVEKKRFIKIFLPNKKFASSLYKKLGSEYYDFLSNIRTYIEYHKKERGS